MTLAPDPFTPVQPLPSSTPILSNLPSTRAAFAKKYSDPSLQAALSRISQPIRQSLINYDLTRAQRGQPPLSGAQTLAALQSAISKQPATPPESQGFFSRALSDIQNIVSEVPHIPFTLYQEAQQLPEAPGKLSEVLGRGGAESIAGLREVPGVRLIPGVYTASQLASEGPGGLLQHPIFTALDVLPYAKPGLSALSESTFSRLPRVQALRAAADIPALNQLRESVGLAPKPIPSSLRLLARDNPALQTVRATAPVRAFSNAFGATTRDIAQIYQATVGRVLQASNPDAPTTLLTPETTAVRNMLTDARDWSTQIAPSRMTELTQRISLDRNAVLSDATVSDSERGFVNQYISHVDEARNLMMQKEWLAQVDGEVFTPPQARRILNSRKQVGKFQALNDIRNQVVNAEEGVVPTVDWAAVRSPHLNVTEREKLLRGYVQAFDAAGYDSSPLLDVLNAQRGPNWRAIGHGPAISQLEQLAANPAPRALIPQSELIDTLRPFARTDPSVARVLDHIRRGDYSTAVKTFHDTLGTRTKHVIPGSDELLDSMKRLRDHNKYVNSTSIYNDRVLAQLQRTNEAVESRLIPARFQPQIAAQFKQSLAAKYAHDETALQNIDKGFYWALPESPQELTRAKLEIAKTWRDMKAQGLDPVFVHGVDPSRLNGLTRPNISDVVRTPTQVRERTMDVAPAIPDAAVALTSQGMEFLNRLGQEEFTNAAKTMWGETFDQVMARYRDASIELAARDPRFDAMGHLSELVRANYTKYTPENPLVPIAIARVSQFGDANSLFIPKAVTDTFEQLFHDKRMTLTSSITDPVMKVFRTSILPLRPAWHVNNIAGGATILAMNTDPSIFIRYARQAVEMVKSGRFHDIEGMPPAGFGSQPADIIAWNKQASFGDKLVATWNYKGGQTLRRLWDSSATARDYASRGVDWSYRFNGFIDDTYRAMAYLYGQDKALTKGLSAHQAEQAGVALVRKILPEWDRMTPIERTVMRSIFPFYSWAGFIIRHAYRYPIDHPYRAAVTASLGRLEQDNLGDALPQRFLDSIFLGHPDSSGNVSSLQLGALNPFRDVANYFTLAGFTRSVNPLISTMLRSLGINPAQGAQDLYPEIAYDPVTGQLRPSNPSLLSSFVNNIIPQTQIIEAMLGRNEQFKQILRTNPDAAAAMLRSSIGLPNLFRTVNPSVEVFKAETQRSTLQSQVKSEALRTGDWGRAEGFPQLRAYFQQIASLMGTHPESFQQYIPSGQPPTTSDAVRQALVGLNTP